MDKVIDFANSAKLIKRPVTAQDLFDARFISSK